MAHNVHNHPYSAIECVIRNSAHIGAIEPLYYEQNVCGEVKSIPVPMTSSLFSMVGQVVTGHRGNISTHTGVIILSKDGIPAVLTSASIFYVTNHNGDGKALVDSAKFNLQTRGVSGHAFVSIIRKIFHHPKFNPSQIGSGFDIAVVELAREHFSGVLKGLSSFEKVSWGCINPRNTAGLNLHIIGYSENGLLTKETLCVGSKDTELGGFVFIPGERQCVIGMSGSPVSVTLALPGDEKRHMVCGIVSGGNDITVITKDLHEWVLNVLEIIAMKQK